MSSHPNKNRLVRIFFSLVILVFLGSVFLFFRSYRELNYKGETLTHWVDALSGSTTNWQREEAEEAIRNIGPKALPQLLLWIDPPPISGVTSNIVGWIDNHPVLQPFLPERIDRSWQAALALGTLGSTAKPAIPHLSKLLKDHERGEAAAMALVGIGPDSLPALTDALSSTNAEAQFFALIALASLGSKAQSTAPVVEKYIHDTNPTISHWAILALGEFGAASESYIPELREMLSTNQHGQTAAFALARLGFINEIFSGLTNASPLERWNCAVALQELLPMGYWNRSTSKVSFFEDVMLGRSYVPKSGIKHVNYALILSLKNYLKVPNPSLRSQAAEALGALGPQAYEAVPSLGLALSDTNESVRLSASNALSKIDVHFYQGGIVRGSRNEKKIALEFTGHTFAEGGETILNELAKHRAKASFFLTGDFLHNPEFAPLVRRMIAEGHYVGPHSDKHLLYCSWDDREKTLVSQHACRMDLAINLLMFRNFITNTNGSSPYLQLSARFWLPAYEWYNQEIVDWGKEEGLTLVNYTPGTRSNADYTQESDTNFVSSQAIFDSIIKKEKEDPRGLNGFLLLMHLGAGPGRKDKMHERFGELLDYLSAKGYEFVRIDDLLEPPPQTDSPEMGK